MIAERNANLVLSRLPAAEPDPILSVMAAFRDDHRAERIDLSAGVYRDASGETPVMRAVKLAEQGHWRQQETKSYLGPAGNPGFNSSMTELILGAGIAVDRAGCIQTPGGSGALRLLFELLRKEDPQVMV